MIAARQALPAALLLALAGCGDDAPANRIDSVASIEISGKGDEGPHAPDVVTVDGDDAAGSVAGTTPMADRVAVLGVLNKRNGESRDITLKPGQAARIGEVVVRLRACERTAPWEPDDYTGAFVQVDVEQPDKSWRRAFSGWLYKERPALNVVQHGIYDVWPKSCTMTFPETGAATVSAGSGGASGDAPKRSSAPKSPATTGAPAASPAEPAPSDAPSNAR